MNKVNELLLSLSPSKAVGPSKAESDSQSQGVELGGTKSTQPLTTPTSTTTTASELTGLPPEDTARLHSFGQPAYEGHTEEQLGTEAEHYDPLEHLSGSSTLAGQKRRPSNPPAADEEPERLRLAGDTDVADARQHAKLSTSPEAIAPPSTMLPTPVRPKVSVQKLFGDLVQPELAIEIEEHKAHNSILAHTGTDNSKPLPSQVNRVQVHSLRGIATLLPDTALSHLSTKLPASIKKKSGLFIPPPTLEEVPESIRVQFADSLQRVQELKAKTRSLQRVYRQEASMPTPVAVKQVDVEEEAHPLSPSHQPVPFSQAAAEGVQEEVVYEQVAAAPVGLQTALPPPSPARAHVARPQAPPVLPHSMNITIIVGWAVQMWQFYGGNVRHLPPFIYVLLQSIAVLLLATVQATGQLIEHTIAKAEERVEAAQKRAAVERKLERTLNESQRLSEEGVARAEEMVENAKHLVEEQEEHDRQFGQDGVEVKTVPVAAGANSSVGSVSGSGVGSTSTAGGVEATAAATASSMPATAAIDKHVKIPVLEQGQSEPEISSGFWSGARESDLASIAIKPVPAGDTKSAAEPQPYSGPNTPLYAAEPAVSPAKTLPATQEHATSPAESTPAAVRTPHTEIAPEPPGSLSLTEPQQQQEGVQKKKKRGMFRGPLHKMAKEVRRVFAAPM